MELSQAQPDGSYIHTAKWLFCGTDCLRQFLALCRLKAEAGAEAQA
jgi:hypothetical protein